MTQPIPSTMTDGLPQRVLPETKERQCPACGGVHIVHAGSVVAGGGMLRSQHRCEPCGTVFWFVRARAPEYRHCLPLASEYGGSSAAVPA
jgi:hypothetical protein